jgi:hypothetical protein
MLLSGLFPTTDWLIDLVNLSFLVIVPALLYSWAKARRDQFALHKKIQLTLFVILFVAVILFEADLRMRGGIFKMVASSRYAGTAFLNSLIYVHTLAAITTSLIWIGLAQTASPWYPAHPRKKPRRLPRHPLTRCKRKPQPTNF